MLGIRDGVLRESGKANPSARDFIRLIGRGGTESAVVGGLREIADIMEEMFLARGCDGFVLAATHVPGAYQDFVRHVVPVLQQRGLYHKEYAGTTLRENLGLRCPKLGAWRVSSTTTAGLTRSAVATGVGRSNPRIGVDWGERTLRPPALPTTRRCSAPA